MTNLLALVTALRAGGTGIEGIAEALVDGLGEPDGAVPVEELCLRLGVDLAGAALEGAAGGIFSGAGLARPLILVRDGDGARRKRFTAAHEVAHLVLGHLDPLHRDAMAERFADRLAALLLAPPARVDAFLRGTAPDVRGVRRLAERFELSTEAAARAYVEHHPEPLAAVIVRAGVVERSFRDRARFPFIQVSIGEPAPGGSAVHRPGVGAGDWSTTACEGWIRSRRDDHRSVVEQVERWRSGGSLALLRLVDADVAAA